MTDVEIGPIVALGAVEEAARSVLRDPQILGVYIDQALRQNYGAEARVARPKDIACATGERTTKYRFPLLLVQAEMASNAERHGDHQYSATLALGVHCVNVGGTEEACRRTSDLHASAVASCLLQRLPGKAAGAATIGSVRWQTNTFDVRPPNQSAAYANCVTQLEVVVDGFLTDAPGRIPSLPPNDPDTTGPAPAPDNLVVVVDLPIEVEDPQP